LHGVLNEVKFVSVSLLQDVIRYAGDIYYLFFRLIQVFLSYPDSIMSNLLKRQS